MPHRDSRTLQFLDVNSFFTGCGTINGNLVIDPGAIVLADCGGTLTFAGIVTNNGTISAINGTFLNFLGPVINTGTMIVTNVDRDAVLEVRISRPPSTTGCCKLTLVMTNAVVCCAQRRHIDCRQSRV